MRQHWQRRAVLLRQALPGIAPPLPLDELLQLAAEEDVESRLISAFSGRWRLQHGPFEPDALPPLTRKRWTLLVQGVDLHDDRAHALLERFRFVPDARVDDLMISVASDGGGVGPHTDSYDVFLVQVWGRRRWRVARPRPHALIPNLPLKMLADFEPEQEFVLDPGDILYLPPGWGHDGIAEGPCMTCSVGFRAPSRHEFLSALLADAADAIAGIDPRFTDRGRAAARRPGELPADLQRQLSAWAHDWRPDARQVNEFIGRFLTEPKPQVWFDSADLPSPRAFAERAGRAGLRLDRRSRMLYRGRQLFINGEAVAADAPALQWLRTLADRRHLTAAAAQQALAHPICADLLRQWCSHGWLHINKA